MSEEHTTHNNAGAETFNELYDVIRSDRDAARMFRVPKGITPPRGYSFVTDAHDPTGRLKAQFWTLLRWAPGTVSALAAPEQEECGTGKAAMVREAVTLTDCIDVARALGFDYCEPPDIESVDVAARCALRDALSAFLEREPAHPNAGFLRDLHRKLKRLAGEALHAAAVSPTEGETKALNGAGYATVEQAAAYGLADVDIERADPQMRPLRRTFVEPEVKGERISPPHIPASVLCDVLEACLPEDNELRELREVAGDFKPGRLVFIGPDDSHKRIAEGLRAALQRGDLQIVFEDDGADDAHDCAARGCVTEEQVGLGSNTLHFPAEEHTRDAAGYVAPGIRVTEATAAEVNAAAEGAQPYLAALGLSQEAFNELVMGVWYASPEDEKEVALRVAAHRHTAQAMKEAKAGPLRVEGGWRDVQLTRRPLETIDVLCTACYAEPRRPCRDARPEREMEAGRFHTERIRAAYEANRTVALRRMAESTPPPPTVQGPPEPPMLPPHRYDTRYELGDLDRAYDFARQTGGEPEYLLDSRNNYCPLVVEGRLTDAGREMLATLRRAARGTEPLNDTTADELRLLADRIERGEVLVGGTVESHSGDGRYTVKLNCQQPYDRERKQPAALPTFTQGGGEPVTPGQFAYHVVNDLEKRSRAAELPLINVLGRRKLEDVIAMHYELATHRYQDAAPPVLDVGFDARCKAEKLGLSVLAAATSAGLQPETLAASLAMTLQHEGAPGALCERVEMELAFTAADGSHTRYTGADSRGLPWSVTLNPDGSVLTFDHPYTSTFGEMGVTGDYSPCPGRFSAICYVIPGEKKEPRRWAQYVGVDWGTPGAPAVTVYECGADGQPRFGKTGERLAPSRREQFVERAAAVCYDALLHGDVPPAGRVYDYDRYRAGMERMFEEFVSPGVAAVSLTLGAIAAAMKTPAQPAAPSNPVAGFDLQAAAKQEASVCGRRLFVQGKYDPTRDEYTLDGKQFEDLIETSMRRVPTGRGVFHPRGSLSCSIHAEVSPSQHGIRVIMSSSRGFGFQHNIDFADSHGQKVYNLIEAVALSDDLEPDELRALLHGGMSVIFQTEKMREARGVGEFSFQSMNDLRVAAGEEVAKAVAQFWRHGRMRTHENLRLERLFTDAKARILALDPDRFARKEGAAS